MNGEFIKRPKADESFEDLLKMQEMWESQMAASGGQTSVKVKRVSRPNKSLASDTIATPNEKLKYEESGNSPHEKTKERKKQSIFNKEAGPARFVLNLDEDFGGSGGGVLCDVEEKNLSCLTDSVKVEALLNALEFSKEVGFPEVLDLAEYYRKGENGEVRATTSGKSFFACEFDRLNGVIDEATCSAKDVSEEMIDPLDYIAENDKYLASLDPAKIMEMKMELEQKLDPRLLAFFKRKRETPSSESKSEPTVEPKPKISKFKLSRTAGATVKSNNTKTEGECGKEFKEKKSVDESAQAPSINVEDMVKQLEVLDEYGDRKEQEKYNRLAADAVQVDFAAKTLRTILPRQQQNAIRLFDSLKNSIPGSSKSDSLCQAGRENIDKIKELYLEEVEVEGKRHTQFGFGLNPLTDAAWTLKPIRNVLDAAHKRSNIDLTPDDVDIVRLSLLWTVLLHDERFSIFSAFAEPNEIYVRLAEVFLLGPSILADDTCVSCVSRLMNGYILKSAASGRLTLRMTAKIADLDAFMPFYEDLLRNFESFSMSDVLFTRTLLIGAYLNLAISDSLECIFGIWSPKMNTARQMTLRISDAKDLLELITKKSEELAMIYEEQHYTTYVSVLGAYVAAIRDEKVTRSRNELMFEIAAGEIGRFVKRNGSSVTPGQKGKEFAALIDIIRSSLQNKLAL